MYSSNPMRMPGLILSMFSTASLKVFITSPPAISSRYLRGKILSRASISIIWFISSSFISSSLLATIRPAEAMKRAMYSSSSLSPTLRRMEINSSMPLCNSFCDLLVAKRLRAWTLMGLTGCDERLIPLSFKKYSRRRLLSAISASMLTFIFSRSRPDAILKNAVTHTPRFSVAM